MKGLSDDRPEVFPLKAQYVPAVLERRAAAREGREGAQRSEGVDGGNADGAMVMKEPDSQPQGEKRVVSEKTWNYRAIRKQYIAEKMAAENCSHKDAAESWEESEPRRSLLGSISVSELKCRKFLPKGADKNPWAMD